MSEAPISSTPISGTSISSNGSSRKFRGVAPAAFAVSLCEAFVDEAQFRDFLIILESTTERNVITKDVKFGATFCCRAAH